MEGGCCVANMVSSSLMMLVLLQVDATLSVENARVREVDAMTSVARLILVLVDRNALDKFFVFQFMRPL